MPTVHRMCIRGVRCSRGRCGFVFWVQVGSTHGRPAAARRTNLCSIGDVRCSNSKAPRTYRCHQQRRDQRRRPPIFMWISADRRAQWDGEIERSVDSKVEEVRGGRVTARTWKEMCMWTRSATAERTGEHNVTSLSRLRKHIRHGTPP